MQDKDRPADAEASPGWPAFLLLQKFRDYGRVLTRRRFMPAKKRQTSTGPPPSFVARIVADYLKLCHDPAQNWRRWLALDSRHKVIGGRGASITREGGQHVVHTEGAGAVVAQADRLRGQPLHELRGRLDADRQGRAALTVCLLDREPILAEITDCDRFEAKKDA